MVWQEKEENKKLKQKQRDRMQPKVGKLDIDYQVLHDAFFKHQTKPHLTRLGEIYYEGKEFEARVRFACCAVTCLSTVVQVRSAAKDQTEAHITRLGRV